MTQLEELFVIPQRGDQGIGSQLLTAAIATLRVRGAAEMHINVDEIDHDTRRFYERRGFTNVLPGAGYRMVCSLREF